MIEDRKIKLRERSYEWQHDPLSPAQLSWRFVDCERPDFTPPGATRLELAAIFVKDHAPAMVARMDHGERERFRMILHSMEVSGPEINRVMGEPTDDVEEQLQADDNASSENTSQTPFSDRILRDWFFGDRALPPYVPTLVSLLGSGPFSLRDFEAFLRQLGVRVVTMDHVSTVLIIGRHDWEEDRNSIDQFIDESNDRPLRIYSQEMFLAHLATGMDPFTAGRQVPNAFKKRHPGLEFVASGWHGWVEPWMRGRTSRGDTIHREELSPLKALGYVVGQRGKPENERRAILQKAFQETLPFVNSSDYMAKWGQNSTGVRLKQIAELIAGLCRAASASRTRDEALRDWLFDLWWLKQEFYRGPMNFEWPEDCIRPVRARGH